MKFNCKTFLISATALLHCIVGNAATPAEKIAANQSPMNSWQFSAYPWFVGSGAPGEAPEIPTLYYPHQGEMLELDMRFRSASRYHNYTGPQRLTFYQKIPPVTAEAEPTWKPIVVTALDTNSQQLVILIDFKKSNKGEVTRGVPLTSDRDGAPPGSVSFVNVSSVPVIVMANEDRYKVRPYGHFMHRFDGEKRGKFSVKAATVVDEAPRLILNRRFMMTDTRRIAYFAFPTTENLSTWTATQLYLDNILPPLPSQVDKL